MTGVHRFRSVVALFAVALLGGSALVASDGINLTVSRGNVSVDQANLVSSGNLAVIRQQVVGQSFTMGGAGTLKGIEIAPLRDTADATDTIFLDVFDASNTLLGTASLPAAGFPPGAGNTPGPLSSATNGPGYFDLLSLGITVNVGQPLSFRLRADFAPGVCSPTTHLCTSGRVGTSCFADFECEKACRAGASGNTYFGGTAVINGTPNSTLDLAFKVLLQATNSNDAVTLDWNGGNPNFTVYRSADPHSVVNTPNEIGTTANRRFVDVPPAGSLWFYRTTGPTVVDQSNLVSAGNFGVARTQHVGQSFTVGIGGILIGIEWAPQLGTAAASDVIFVDVYDAGNTLLGTGSITAAGFPPGNGVPAPLSLATTGPGYVDLSSLGITVDAGEVLSFVLRPDFTNDVKVCHAGLSTGGAYAAGQSIVNGVPSPSFDLAFKTFVRPEAR